MPSRRPSALVLAAALAVALWPGSLATSHVRAAPLPPPGLTEVAGVQVPSLDALELRSFSAIVVELPSGRIVGAQDADLTLPLASLTKLMTAVVALESRPPLDRQVTLTPADSSGLIAKYKYAGDSISRFGVPAGEQLTVRDLLAASLIASANNAAAGLARTTALTRAGFVQRMNRRAAALGLGSATFADPTGLDVANQANALDVARLARYAWQNQTLRELSGSPTYTFTTAPGREYHLKHTNPLTRGRQGFTVLASKTGYLDEAGYNLAMVIRDHRHREYLMVLLNAPTAAERTQDARTLTHWLESHG